ncbi:cytochrome b/b6 domain-containing protein [Vibrio renipiscarius]|uniref:Hydrogenase n=1 Tax=Vibrio renipiscarius TaxID=1461322 RepID=A0A0C2NSP4_9VIBR|nr:cytochrome b/b6 domain-containing protein [Vibrio renipiscarius]KII76095.1 hydrogenase [Vibrio renipiscarius]KII79200.1 hydrogenase [Vibrio renipiscarius]
MKIWDLPTRLYHWLQALLFIGLMTGVGPHLYLGLALFTLILWRIVWGFIGSDTSRFQQFLSSPARTIRYLRGKETSHAGHNPAGSWMVVALISAILLQCITGMALVGLFDDLPYAELLLSDQLIEVFRTLHGACARLLMGLVALHLVAILVYKLRSKPLVMAMLTGKQKASSADNTRPTLVFASNKRALFVFFATGLITVALMTSAGML